MAFTPFQMPSLNMQPNGAYGYQGAQTQYVDNATPLGNQHGWADPRTQGMQTRDVMRYQNGMTLEGMNTGFNGLGNQMSGGFNDLAEQMQYGGQFGSPAQRNYSPQSKNGFGGANPFMIGSF